MGERGEKTTQTRRDGQLARSYRIPESRLVWVRSVLCSLLWKSRPSSASIKDKQMDYSPSVAAGASSSSEVSFRTKAKAMLDICGPIRSGVFT